MYVRLLELSARVPVIGVLQFVVHGVLRQDINVVVVALDEPLFTKMFAETEKKYVQLTHTRANTPAPRSTARVSLCIY